MFPMFKKLELLKTIADINFETIDMTSRLKVISAGLATHLGRKISLPTTAVVSVKDYFQSNVASELRDAIGGFNETYPICVDYVEELTFKIFLMRYEAVFCTMDMPVSGCENFDDRFFNLRFFFSAEDQKFLNDYATHISLVCKRLGEAGVAESMNVSNTRPKCL